MESLALDLMRLVSMPWRSPGDLRREDPAFSVRFPDNDLRGALTLSTYASFLPDHVILLIAHVKHKLRSGNFTIYLSMLSASLGPIFVSSKLSMAVVDKD